MKNQDRTAEDIIPEVKMLNKMANYNRRNFLRILGLTSIGSFPYVALAKSNKTLPPVQYNLIVCHDGVADRITAAKPHNGKVCISILADDCVGFTSSNRLYVTFNKLHPPSERQVRSVSIDHASKYIQIWHKTHPINAIHPTNPTFHDLYVMQHIETFRKHPSKSHWLYKDIYEFIKLFKDITI